MKLIFNYVQFCLFIIQMHFTIEDEIRKVKKIIPNCNSTFRYDYDRFIFHGSDYMSFLLAIFQMTREYPEIEPYLESLLTNFYTSQLEWIFIGYSALHYLVVLRQYVSLNAFKIIIEKGIDLNHIDAEEGGTALHEFCRYGYYDSHSCDILNLLIEHGIDLNITDKEHKTALDVISTKKYLGEDLKKFIETMINSGARCNNTKNSNQNVLNFIECYNCRHIKPAKK